jgi:hypothetical protein
MADEEKSAYLNMEDTEPEDAIRESQTVEQPDGTKVKTNPSADAVGGVGGSGDAAGGGDASTGGGGGSTGDAGGASYGGGSTGDGGGASQGGGSTGDAGGAA